MRDLRRAGFLVHAEGSIAYNRFNPRDFTRSLSSSLSDLRPKRVVVDITSMSRLCILLTLWAVTHKRLNVSIFYAEAEHYGPSQEDYEQARGGREFLRPSIRVYGGVQDVVRLSELSSVSMQGQPTAALAFMSFNEVLTQALLNNVLPSRFFLINGRPPVHRWREEATAWIHEELRREWEDDNPLAQNGRGGLPIRSCSTLEYRETIELLVALYWKLSSKYRIVLAPTGSKLQAVGCFIVKCLFDDIHVEYPTPVGYLDSYSTGIGPTWSLELGELGRRVAAVRSQLIRERFAIEVPAAPSEEGTGPTSE